MRKQTMLLAALSASTMLVACGDDAANNGSANANTGTDTPVVCDGNICNVQGEILEDVTFEAGNQYNLLAPVFVGNGTDAVTLTIEPGVTIYGDTSQLTFLAVRQNAQIDAEGTATEPIVFTSANDLVDAGGPGDWGGIIINGKAPLNTGATAEGEGGTGVYGGTETGDSSGTLKYVQIRYAGFKITEENELNSLALQGVGSGTTIEYVQVHRGSDDGIEFYGGTVNAAYLVATGIQDDSFDWTDGWQGSIQYAVAQQYGDDADQGIEADNNSDAPDATPRSNPVLTNFTLIGSGTNNPDTSDIGLLLRVGTAASLDSFIITGFNESCVDIDDDATFTNAGDDFAGLTAVNSIVHCPSSEAYAEEEGDAFTVMSWWEDQGNVNDDPGLEDPYNTTTPGWLPAAGSLGEGLGAFPDGTDWTEGWTVKGE
jgi:hypothetical protein